MELYVAKETEPEKGHSTEKKAKKGKIKFTGERPKNGGQCVQSGGVSDSNVNNQVNSSCGYQNPTFTFPYPFTQPPAMNFLQQMPFGGGQQPGNMAQSQPSAMPFMNPTMSPTQIPSSQPMYNMPLPPPSTPPNWMSDLINDVKQIKLSLEKLDKIEKTVNSISLKVSTPLKQRCKPWIQRSVR